MVIISDLDNIVEGLDAVSEQEELKTKVNVFHSKKAPLADLVGKAKAANSDLLRALNGPGKPGNSKKQGSGGKADSSKARPGQSSIGQTGRKPLAKLSLVRFVAIIASRWPQF